MANRSLNKVLLIGNLTRDPELRYTPSGVAVCNLGLATNRRWTDSEGNLQEETEFHRLVAWGKLAELCSQLLFKGRKVFIEGRLQTREWTAQDGTKRTTTEIVIDNMLVLDRRVREEGMPKGTQAAPAAAPVGKPVADKKADDRQKQPGDTKEPAEEKEKKVKKKEEKKEEATKDKEDKEKVKAEDIPF
jgi:single-strand DNA-binding protein